MRRRAAALIAVAIGGLLTVAAVEIFRDTDKGSPPAAVSSGPSAAPTTTTTAAPPLAFCPETAKSNQVRSPSGLDGKTGPRTPSGPHRLAYFEVDDKGMTDLTGSAASYLPTGTSQQGRVQVLVCAYATPTNKRIGTCDGYQVPKRGSVSAVVTGVQYAYKAYDADSKRLLDAFALPGLRSCPSSVTTVDDVPQSIEARSDYTAVIARLLPQLRR